MLGETSNTWLQSLKSDENQTDGWRTLVKSYDPFVRRILTKHGLQSDVVDDVTQNVMTVVIRRLPEFERQRTGSFRTWLRAITINCLRDFWKCRHEQILSGGGEDFDGLIESMEDPRSDFTRMWNREHAEHVMGTLLDEVASEFSPKTVEVFRRLAIHEEEIDEVSRDLDMTPNACFIARSRVLKRLREMLVELFGEDGRQFELFL